MKKTAGFPTLKIGVAFDITIVATNAQPQSKTFNARPQQKLGLVLCVLVLTICGLS
ncbi:MAG: hypothetical protein ACLP2Y_13175 [Limisphaerales bacterium]